VPFVFGPEQLAAQEDLKSALLDCHALRAIEYASDSPVILAVDTSWIAVGFHLCQCDIENPKIRYYSRFGSITLNEREGRFSQPKLELYGLYRSLRSLRLYLIGIRNLVIEVDARYIKGMLANPDIQPSASINRWIVSILTFHFELVHVAGSFHGPDGLSRRPRQPGDEEEKDDEDDFDDWIDRLYGFVHLVNKHPIIRSSKMIATFPLGEDLSEEDSFPDENVTYEDIPRSNAVERVDAKLVLVKQWLEELVRPLGFSNEEYSCFMRYCTQFFVAEGRLWRKDPQGAHKLVVNCEKRLLVMRSAHDDLGHKGFYATRALIMERFWWPQLPADVIWFVRSCHLCQLRQTRQVLIPPVVATPAPLFAKVYMDTMHLPPSRTFKHVVQGRCSLVDWPEFHMLQSENARMIGDWIFEDILCRWGALREIVTDNGPQFIKAMEYVAKRYHIKHIRISGYNSRANGIAERPHFDV